jgi:hypothetical protein
VCAIYVLPLSLSLSIENGSKNIRKEEGDSIHQGYSFADQTQKRKRPRKSAGAAERNRITSSPLLSVHTSIQLVVVHKRKREG